MWCVDVANGYFLKCMKRIIMGIISHSVMKELEIFANVLL